MVGLFFCGWQSIHLTVALVEDLLKVALRLEVEVLHVFRVIHGLWVDFVITLDDSLPDFFLHLFQIDVEVLIVLHVPERVVNFDTLVQLTVNQRLRLALDHDFEVLGLDVAQNLACLRPRRKLNLHIDVEHLLGPLVICSGASIVSRNSLVNVNVSACRKWLLRSHLGRLLIC